MNDYPFPPNQSVIPEKVRAVLGQRPTMDQVLELAQRVPVFPVRIWWDATANKLQKVPAISKKNGGRGHLDAVKNPEAVRQLFPRARHWNALGVPMGEVSGVDALDLDLQHPEAQAWAAQHPLPPTS